jgi:hypothetical protein
VAARRSIRLMTATLGVLGTAGITIALVAPTTNQFPRTRDEKSDDGVDYLATTLPQ